MRGITPALLIGLLITWTARPRATEAWQVDPPIGAGSSGPDFVQDIRPLLKTYCFECHNSTKRKAGLDLEQIDTAAAAIDLHDLWDQVGERLCAKEMPPAKGKQPTEDERQRLLGVGQARGGFAGGLRQAAEGAARTDPGRPAREPPVEPGRVQQHAPRPVRRGPACRRPAAVRRRGRRRLRQRRRHALHHAGPDGEIPGGGRAGPGHAVPGRRRTRRRPPSKVEAARLDAVRRAIC